MVHLARQTSGRNREGAPRDRAATSYPAEDVVVGRVKKNSREAAVVRLTEFKGVRLIDLRSWVAGQDGDLRPTGKGLAISVDRIAELKALLHSAETKASELGWIAGKEEPAS